MYMNTDTFFTQTHRISRSFNCKVCGEHYTNLVTLQHHKQTAHSSQPSASRRRALVQYGAGSSSNQRAFNLTETSINGAAQTYRLPLSSTVNEEYVAELTSAVLVSSREQIEQLSRERNIKWYLTLSLVFHRASRPDVLTDPSIYFRTEPVSSTSCKYSSMET